MQQNLWRIAGALERIAAALEANPVPFRSPLRQPNKNRQPFDLERAVALYNEGKIIKDVAAEMGVSSSLVHKRLQEAGIPVRPRGTRGRPGAPVDIDAAKAMYSQGHSLLEIAEAFKTDAGRIGKILQQNGVVIRSHGAGQKAKTKMQDKPRIEFIRQARAEGKTLEEIGAALHITRERVRQLCVKNGISAERFLTPKQVAAVQQYVSGDSLELTARMNDTSPSTLIGWVLRAGYIIRPSARKPKVRHDTLRRAKIAGRMYRQGATIKEIAEALTNGVGGGAVYRLLAYEGIRPDRASGDHLHNSVERQ